MKKVYLTFNRLAALSAVGVVFASCDGDKKAGDPNTGVTEDKVKELAKAAADAALKAAPAPAAKMTKEEFEAYASESKFVKDSASAASKLVEKSDALTKLAGKEAELNGLVDEKDKLKALADEKDKLTELAGKKDDLLACTSTLSKDKDGNKFAIASTVGEITGATNVLSYFKALQTGGLLKQGTVNRIGNIIFRTNKDVAPIANASAFLTQNGKQGSARKDFEYLHKGEWISFNCMIDKNEANDNEGDGKFNANDYKDIESIEGLKQNLASLNVA